MNPVYSAVAQKLEKLPVRTALILPDGTRLGQENPKICLRFRDKVPPDEPPAILAGGVR